MTFRSILSLVVDLPTFVCRDCIWYTPASFSHRIYIYPKYIALTCSNCNATCLHTNTIALNTEGHRSSSIPEPYTQCCHEYFALTFGRHWHTLLDFRCKRVVWNCAICGATLFWVFICQNFTHGDFALSFGRDWAHGDFALDFARHWTHGDVALNFARH